MNWGLTFTPSARQHSGTFKSSARRAQRRAENAEKSLKVVDRAGDAVFEDGYVEVDEQAEPAVAKTKMRQELAFVNPQDGLDGLDLYNHLALDK